MATQVEDPKVPDYMAEVAAARVTYPWPEVFRLLEAVPDEGLESMPDGDQCQLWRGLMRLLAGTRHDPGANSLARDVAQVLVGRNNRVLIEWVRELLAVFWMQELTPEELAQYAKAWGE